MCVSFLRRDKTSVHPHYLVNVFVHDGGVEESEVAAHRNEYVVGCHGNGIALDRLQEVLNTTLNIYREAERRCPITIFKR